MAASYTRRINLYINQKYITNDLVSIRKEMSKLVNEQARMTVGSKEYVKHASQIKSLKRIIDQHNNDLSTTAHKWNSFQKMADAANRYFAVITAGIAAVTGAAMVIKSTVEAFAEYDDKLIDVMKTTDLAKQETIELSDEIRKIDTRTAHNDLLELARVAGKLGNRGKKDILGFVKATDMIRVALSADLGGDTEESVRQLGKLVDIFKLTNEFSVEESLLKIGSAMNALGASGTANEGYMLEFSKRVAGVAPTAGFTIDKILGLATTLDELGQTSEVSATAFNQVISNMFKKTADYAKIAGMSLEDFTKLINEDANEAMIQLLIGARGSSGGFDELAKSLSGMGMDGVRATTVLGSLAVNIDKLRENQKFSNEEFVKGIDILIEFNKKNSSAQAKLEKHIKLFKQIQVELGEKLTPIYSEVIHKASTLLKVFGATTEFLFKYGSTIITVTGFLLAYAAAAKLTAIWEARKNTYAALGIALSKTQAALAPVLALANIASLKLQILFMGKRTAVQIAHIELLKKEIMYTKMFGLAVKANPLMIAITAIAALVVAIKAYDKYNEQAIKRENEKAAALKNLTIITGGYSDSLENLSQTVKESNTLTRQQKILAAEQNKELMEHAAWELKRQKEKQAEIKTMFTQISTWEKMILLLRGAPLIRTDGKENAAFVAKALENGTAAAAEMDEKIQQMSGHYQAIVAANKQWNQILNAEAHGDAVLSESLVMMHEKLAKYNTALENAVHGGEDYLRIQKKIAAVEAKINKPKWDSNDIIAEKMEVLTAAFNKKQSLIRKNYLEGKMSEDEYNHQMLLSELKFLKDKLSIYNAGSQEYMEAVNKSLELQVTVDNKLRDLQLKAEEELANAKIDNFRDEFIRQQKAEEQRWQDEKTALELRLIDKVALNAKEQAINDAINALIEEKEKTHQQKMIDLKSGQKLSELQELSDAATPFDTEFAELSEMQLMFDAKTALIEEQYKQEKELAAGNHAFLLGAEKRYNDALLQLKLNMIDAEWQQKEQRIEAGQAFVGALSGIVDQETALGKALFAFNQGLAIAEIWMSVAKANAKSVASSPLTAGMPWVAINTAVGAAQTALVLAQTVKAFSKPAEKGYSDGGHTGPGGINEPAGIVHKKEYVVPASMLANPQVSYIVDMLEKMRTRKISLSQAAIPMLSSGGFSTSNRNSASVQLLPNSNDELIKQQNETNAQLAVAITMFLKHRPTVAVESIEREREKYLQIIHTKGL